MASHPDLPALLVVVHAQTVTIEAFGPLRIAAGATRSAVRGKPATLLAVLACFSGRTVPTRLAVEALWDVAAPPPDESNALRAVVRRLQTMLPSGTMVTGANGLRLDESRAIVDVTSCAQLLASSSAEQQRAGLALWTDEPFGEARHVPAVQVEIDRLTALRLDVVEQLCARQLELGSAYPLVAELEQLVTLHPERERLWQLLATALHGCSRRVDALRTFDRCRAALGRVTATTLRLEQRVILDELEPALDLAG
jgi:DNA-binding SARP family transcriptional activator